MQSGAGMNTNWGLACKGQAHEMDPTHRARPSTPGAGCDLGTGRPPPPLSTSCSLDSVRIAVLGLQTEERQRAVYCSVPAVITDAKLLTAVAAACGLQPGLFWLQGPQSRPI
eukprot:12906459-Prorocentrum_lima.AAC.1